MIASEIDSADLVTGGLGVHTAHETDAHDAEEDRNFEEEESCEEESDLTAAFELEMDEQALVVEELEDTLDVQDVEDLRELSESMYEGLATIRETHAKLRENEESRLPAFLVCLFSCSFRFATCLFEWHWPRERKGQTLRRVCSSEEARSSLFGLQPISTLLW